MNKTINITPEGAFQNDIELEADYDKCTITFKMPLKDDWDREEYIVNVDDDIKNLRRIAMMINEVCDEWESDK